jgi:beta-galactosidase beta subunit
MLKTTKKNPIAVLVGTEVVFVGTIEQSNEKVNELLKEDKNPIFLRNDQTKRTICWSKGRCQKNYYKEEVDYILPEEIVSETTSELIEEEAK